MIEFLLLLFVNTAAAQTNNVYIEQVGNNNSIYIQQDYNGGKTATINNTGDYNELSIIQNGTGYHSASITKTTTTTNNNNTIGITQSGSAAHSATVQFQNTNANSNNVSITQAGNATKTFNLGLEGSGINVTVIQDNPNTSDYGSMNIQCLTPPCNGYSYIKR